MDFNENYDKGEENSEIVVRPTSERDAFNTDLRGAGYDMIGGTSNSVFELKEIPADDIYIPERVRKKVDMTLYSSIRRQGLLTPIIVMETATDGKYLLVDGFMRIIACRRCGMTTIPCIVNKALNPKKLHVIELVYNHSFKYKMREIVDCIKKLEEREGIKGASFIEYLLQMKSGDYAKLKDLQEDGDEEILQPLLEDKLSIAEAYNKLERRRKKESAEEQRSQQEDKIYNKGDIAESERLIGSGEVVDEDEMQVLTDEQIKEIAINPMQINEGLGDETLEEMVERGKQYGDFKPTVQDKSNRTHIDADLRKAVIARDGGCRACGINGSAYVDSMDVHHVIPVHLGGEDSMENLITLCILCHRMVHLYSYGQLHIPEPLPYEALNKLTTEERVRYFDERDKFKRIVRLGDAIRHGMSMKRMNLEEAKKKFPIYNVGRRYPTAKQSIT